MLSLSGGKELKYILKTQIKGLKRFRRNEKHHLKEIRNDMDEISFNKGGVLPSFQASFMHVQPGFHGWPHLNLLSVLLRNILGVFFSV